MQVMTPMFNGVNLAHVNALLIQPTSFCGRNCQGCYAKSFKNQKTFPSLMFLKELHNLDFLANQFTLALDKLPTDSFFEEAQSQRTVMQDFFNSYMSYASRKADAAEFHLTVHAYPDFVEYITLNEWPDQYKLDMISVTLLPNEYGCTYLRAFAKHLNWNLTLSPGPGYFDHRLLDLSNGILARFLDRVDSAYVVLHKPTTGQKIDPAAFKLYSDFLMAIDNLPSELKSKIQIDTCVKDSERFLSTGFGCSANISKFQLWPDGSVTGCPYKQSPTTPPAVLGLKDQVIESIFRNFYIAKQDYEFKSCKIPDAIKNKDLQKFNHLEIL